MMRGWLLLQSFHGVYTYPGSDDASLLLRHLGDREVEDDVAALQRRETSLSDDDHSVLQAPATGKPRAPLAEPLAQAQSVQPHAWRKSTAEARKDMALMQMDGVMSVGVAAAATASWYDAPDKAVSVLQGGIKLPMNEPVMTVCNAYAYPEPLDIKLLRTGEQLLNGLLYKECADMADLDLRAGDELEFTARSSPLGVFHMANIPQGAQLLLVPHRRHTDSYLMKFESHAFQRPEYKQPMIATIDTYSGDSSTYVRLVQDSLHSENAVRVENVSYGTVSLVTVGDFQVQLVGHQGELPRAYANVSTGLGRNYVALRVGGGNYPEELVVYPKGFHSAAWRVGLSSLAVVLVLVMKL